MDIDRDEARRRLTKLEPAQFRMVELLAEGRTFSYIAERFNDCKSCFISRQLVIARAKAGAESNAQLVEFYRAAQ